MSNTVLDLRGRKVAVAEGGQGEPLVYLHGFADVHGVVGELQPFHLRLCEAARVIAPAHPGCAESGELADGCGIEDVVFCFLRFPSGKVAHMHLSWLDPHKMRRMTVVGREKMVVFDDMELERKVTVYEKAPWEPASTYGEWRTRTGDISSPKIPNDEPLRLELEHFLRLVAEGPGDHREAGKAKLRLLYEANPMSFLIEQAGGASIDGAEPIMDVAPIGLHQRVGVVLGDAEEVALVADYGRTG